MIMRMGGNVIGLDIGGANLKAATADGRARSRLFELWKHPDRLGIALRELLNRWLPSYLAVTMTGELCDCFETKRDGVARILAEIVQAFPETPIAAWSTDGCFITIDEANHHPMKVAASNWHALATFAERIVGDDSALMIDVGSTTSDIIPIWQGRPMPLGRTDPERLRSKELVYTGFRRTPICALLQDGIAAEFFATTQDAYLRLGLIAEDADDCHTADGRPATVKNAHARLSRMLGGDPEITSDDDTHHIASKVYAKQRQLLVDAIDAVSRRLPQSPRQVILFGSGEFLARAAWSEFSRARSASKGEASIISLAERLGPEVSTAACAYAVAVLAEESWTS